MYRTIDAAFWTDPKVRQLNHEGKFLLLYFITNPHTHVSGIYVLPAPTIQHETGLSKRALDTLCDTLSSLGFCRFDPQLDVIWVRKMMAYQGKGEKNLRSAARHVSEDLHKSSLCCEFLASYPDVKRYTDPVFLDTLCDTVSSVGTPHSPLPTPDINTSAIAEFPSDFLEFWKAYPKKNGKRAALTVWTKLHPSAELKAKMLATLDWQKKSHDWTKEGGTYIPDPERWLKKGKWDDEPPRQKSLTDRPVPVC